MIERFREWGAGLSEEELACALAAFGVLRGRSMKRTLDWRFDPRLFDTSAVKLAQAWRIVRDTSLGPILIRLDPEVLDRAGIDPLWLRSHLLQGSGAFILIEPAREAPPLSRGIDLGPPVVKREEWQGPRHGSYGVSDDGSVAKSGSVGDGSFPDSRPAPPPVRTRRKEEVSPRFLQARLHSGKRPLRGALRPGQPCSAAIRVGLPDPGWTSGDRPFPTPEEPPEPKGHRLTVIFSEPRIRPEPEVRTLWLPRKGSSEPVEFSFDAPAGADSIAARITVLHANRVLQTGLLRVPIGTKGRWTFELDATPRTRLEGLSARTLFAAALILSHDGDGMPRLTASSDGQAVVLTIDGEAIGKLTRVLGERISDVAIRPKHYKGLESPGSVELLRELAQKGAVLHDHLCKHTKLGQIAGAGRIHITAATAESFFPAELLYRFRPPSDTAGLCPHARKALLAGDCTGDCPSDKRKTICPLGFWGLSKVIERHAHKPEDQDGGAVELHPEPVRPRSLLPISGSALLGASGKVAEFKKDAVTRLLNSLQKRGTAILATTWKEWERYVRSRRPRLLVLLPHHDRDEDGDEFLEIGKSERLETDQIWDEIVRRLPNGPNPVVLLMGCETNLTEISFENPVVRFRDHGASVVVSTIATILGRHASPATETLVQLLDRMADGKHTFGDIMLRLRQILVARETPMALGLTSYGDADWILVKEAR